MVSPAGVLCCVSLLCNSVWDVASLKGATELNNDIIQTLGGEKATDVWVPRFVFNRKTICAGVTLTAEADLTSATCLRDDEPLEAFVVVESHGQNVPPVQVAHIDRCVKFDEEHQAAHDVMVCFHHCQWNFSDTVFVPRLHLEWDSVPREFDEMCSVMGFGHSSADGEKCNVMRTVEIRLGPSRECSSEHSDVQNYVCGTTTKLQESCAVDGGEPLLCRHGGSEFFVHGICKEDCSAPQKHKFLLLGYYRDWLQRTVPGLLSSSGSQRNNSSPGVEGGQNSDATAASTQKTDEPEKCPVLTRPPPVHGEEHSGRPTSTDADGTISSSVAPDTPRSGYGDVSMSEVQNSGGTDRQTATSIEVLPADRQDFSGSVQSVSEESRPTPVLSKDSNSGNSYIQNDTSPTDGEVPPTATPVRVSSGDDRLRTGDPIADVPSKFADDISDIILLSSLADSWYISNDTNSVPHPSDEKRTLDLDRLKKLISEGGAVLNFSYVVDSRSRANGTVSKQHLASSNESTKVVAESPKNAALNSMKSTGLKSQDGGEKRGRLAIDTGEASGVKSQNVVPSDGEPLVREKDRDKPQMPPPNLHRADGSRDAAGSSLPPSGSLPAEPPYAPPKERPAAPVSITLDPSRWDWLKQNALRVPKNPLQNPKIVGKGLLFKQPNKQQEDLSRQRFAEEYWRRGEKRMWPDSDSTGVPTEYRAKWSVRHMSYPLSPTSLYSLEDLIKSDRFDRALSPGNVASERSVRSKRGDRDLRETSFSGADRKFADTSASTGHPTDGRQTHRTFGSPSVEPGKRGPSLSLSANWRQPEGTFFGVLSSTVKTRLKRSGTDDTADRNTLLADLADWPARVGIAPSELMPRVSFLTSINESATTGRVESRPSFALYFRILRAFLPGGNVARRLDMYKKELVWGPPITHDEFEPLVPNKPCRTTTEAPQTTVPPDAGEEPGKETTLEPPGGPPSPSPTTSIPVTQADARVERTAIYPQLHNFPSLAVRRQVREVENDFLTTLLAVKQNVSDVDDISPQLSVKDESRTVGNTGSGSPEPSDSGELGTGKETTLSAADNQSKITHPTDDTPRESTVSAAGIQEDTTLPAVDAEKMSTLLTADTGKQTLHSTVNTERETLRPSEEKLPTSVTNADRRGTKVPSHGDDRPEFYTKMKQLGAADGSGTTWRVVSVLHVLVCSIITWISLPRI